MIVTADISTVRAQRWADPTLSWGLVPTMGYLHAGHLSLVSAAKVANQRVAVSIYVNPTQFAPSEDLAAYPRDLERDLAMLEAAGVDLVFTPDNSRMYPPGFQTRVEVTQVTRQLEGASRPTHFSGVTLVVAKFFNIFQPTRAYFGQKDAQQVVVLQRMVTDLNFNLELVVCPIVREGDGLALSSRNKYLSAAEREAAPVLYRALKQAEQLSAAGERRAATLIARMEALIQREPLARLDYVNITDSETLEDVAEINGECLISLAVFFGPTRLIDNIRVKGEVADTGG